jgi:hypothetical protein
MLELGVGEDVIVSADGQGVGRLERAGGDGV